MPKLFSKTWSQTDFDRIQKLISLASKGDVAEVEIEADGVRVLVRKHPKNLTQPDLQPPVSVISQSVASPQSLHQESSADALEGSKPVEPPHANSASVLSPMVGTFYTKPAPDLDPFVQVGDVVAKGQIVCIVEAMKVMNEVEADTAGTIREILVDDGEGVEFDQPLLLIEPSS